MEDEVDEKYYINKPFHLVNKGHQAELDIKGQDCIKRVYGTDKIAPTLTTMGGGMREPKILDVLDFVGGIGDKDWVGDNKKLSRNYPQGNRVYNSKGIACSQTSNGGGLGGPTGLYLINSDTPKIESVERTPLKFLNRNGKKTDGQYTFCVDTCHTGGIKEHYSDNSFRIRKLTPRECFRLMGLKNDDIDRIQQAGISNTQQYKMAGNSIVVDVLEVIFRNLFLD